MRKLYYFLFLLLVLSCTDKKQQTAELKIKFGKVEKKSIFSGGKEFSHWGGSIVKGEDGLYHMFYSRWPKEIGWEWVNYSEIAHATSISPFGPFQFVDIALSERDPKYWDASCTHNPTVHKFNGKYYLYYMGNFGDKKIVSVPGKAKINWTHRNNQRIGVAVATSPNGPWLRFDEPVLDIAKEDSMAHDALMVSNPSVCQMEDGKILLIYKAVGKKYALPSGGPVVHMVAIGDTPTGPFKKYENPIFLEKGVRFPAEDPTIWYQEKKYHAIVKYIQTKEKKRTFSLVHYDSKDGINWEKAKNFKVSDLSLQWKDGGEMILDHLERPQILLENGVPFAVACAADTYDKNHIRNAFNVQIPLEIIKE